jgi:hypothetical protein
MAQQAAAQVAQRAAASLVAMQAGSRAAALGVLRADVAARAALRADAAVVVAAAMSDAKAPFRDGRRLRRTLNPRSSFYPPCRCSDAARIPARRSQPH